MPAYVCDRCNKAFRSKKQLREHMDEHPAQVAEDTSTVLDDVQHIVGMFHPANLASKVTKKNLAIAFGVLMMGTLFVGTALFMMTTAPPGQQGPTGQATAMPETNPPVGYSIASERDIPSVDTSQLPSGTSVDRELSHDEQLYLLIYGGQSGVFQGIQPAVLLQYNCELLDDCETIASELVAIAADYGGWTYVAPNTGIDDPIALTALQREPMLMDDVDAPLINDFVCASLQFQPIACALR